MMRSNAVLRMMMFLLMLAMSGAEDQSPLNRFTAEQREKIQAGEAVYAHVESKDAQGRQSGHGEASVLIRKPVEECFRMFCEFDKHQLYFPRKKKSEVLKTWENKALVHKEFEFYVATIEYTVLYTVDKERHRVEFQLDPAYPHDLNDTAGYFQFEKINDNTTLFTYAATKVDTGLKVPGFIQEYLTSRDLPAVVLNVKKRIESGGTWTKE